MSMLNWQKKIIPILEMIVDHLLSTLTPLKSGSIIFWWVKTHTIFISKNETSSFSCDIITSTLMYTRIHNFMQFQELLSQLEQ